MNRLPTFSIMLVAEIENKITQTEGNFTSKYQTIFWNLYIRASESLVPDL